jgi:hypothetical protein
MKRTLVVILGLFIVLLLSSTFSNSVAAKGGCVNIFVSSHSPNSSGSWTGPNCTSGNFTTKSDGSYSWCPGAAGNYCICVTGTGGGQTTIYFDNSNPASAYCTNGASCTCLNC